MRIVCLCKTIVICKYFDIKFVILTENQRLTAKKATKIHKNMVYAQFLLGLVILIFSGKYLVQGGVSIAKFFKISPLIIGMTVVAFGTSAPELIVSINAAVSGNPEIAFGNVIGSNIANIALVLALTAVLIPIPVNRNSLVYDWPMMGFLFLLLYFFILDDFLNLYEGVILFGLLLLYIVFIFKKAGNDDNAVLDEVNNSKTIGWGLAVLMIALSSVGLAVGADFLVSSASEIALNWGVSQRVISLSIVAFGTSLPELTASIMAALKKQTDISVGNIIGSNIFNISVVLGITSMISPIPIDHASFNLDIMFMIFVAILLLLFIYPFKTVYLNRVEGALLFVSYIAYMTFITILK